MLSNEELLTDIVHQLLQWIKETHEGGWSTHQVDPMRRLSTYIFQHLNVSYKIKEEKGKFKKQPFPPRKQFKAYIKPKAEFISEKEFMV